MKQNKTTEKGDFPKKDFNCENQRTEISYLKEKLLYHFTKVMSLIDRIEQESALNNCYVPVSTPKVENKNNKNIPKMATINETVEFLEQSAKETNVKNCLTAYSLRQLALTNQIVHVRSGSKILINIDKLIEFLNTAYSPEQNTKKTKTDNKYGISRIEV